MNCVTALSTIDATNRPQHQPTAGPVCRAVETGLRDVPQFPHSRGTQLASASGSQCLIEFESELAQRAVKANL